MAKDREQKMSKGVLLFAFDTEQVSYFKMAIHAAKRANLFLDLPVSVVTDKNSLSQKHEGIFDHVIAIDPDKSNRKDRQVWMNKERTLAYELSPYDETLLLDVDYIINSPQLLNLFSFNTDFCCHDKASFLLWAGSQSEILSKKSYSTLWATVVYFARTKRSKQIFDCMKMIQNNYHYYSLLHGFLSKPYRNDFALTLALRIANGHLDDKSMFIPWSLLHTDKNTVVTATDDNTKFKISMLRNTGGKLKNEYILTENYDFHVMDKKSMQELVA